MTIFHGYSAVIHHRPHISVTHIRSKAQYRERNCGSDSQKHIEDRTYAVIKLKNRGDGTVGNKQFQLRSSAEIKQKGNPGLHASTECLETICGLLKSI